MVKFFAVFLFLGFPLFGAAQFIDPEVEWFGLDDFFLESIVKNHGIHQIEIKEELKKDGEMIKSGGNSYKYVFDSKGYLFKSFIYSNIHKRRDTSIRTVQYNFNMQITSETQDYGYYTFQYQNTYNDNSDLVKKLKLNPKTGDTAFIREYVYDKLPDRQTISYLNSNGQAFKTETIEVSDSSKIITTQFVRNSNFTKQTFYYRPLLQSVSTESHYGKSKRRSKDFIYNNGLLTDVIEFSGGRKSKRWGFVYSNEGLLNNIVMRDYDMKLVKIFNFDYQFY